MLEIDTRKPEERWVNPDAQDRFDKHVKEVNDSLRAQVADLQRQLNEMTGERNAYREWAREENANVLRLLGRLQTAKTE